LDEGRFGIDDVFELMMLTACTSLFGTDLNAYLYREEKSERDAKVARIKQLSMEFRATRDPERRAVLAREMDELNGMKGKDEA
jgi:hypothetical protein